MTPEDRAAAYREKARLRSERWRRAHGIDGLLTGLTRELARADMGLGEMGAIIAELEACRAAVPLRC